MGKGVSLKNLKEYQKALEVYDKALELDPDFEPAKKEREEISALNQSHAQSEGRG